MKTALLASVALASAGFLVLTKSMDWGYRVGSQPCVQQVLEQEINRQHRRMIVPLSADYQRVMDSTEVQTLTF